MIMYPSMAYGGCQRGDLDQLYKSVCQGFDLSLFGEDSVGLTEASDQPSYEESVPFVGFQEFQEQDFLTPEDTFSYSSFGEAAWNSPDLHQDQAYPGEFPEGKSRDYPDCCQDFTPINEMGSEVGSEGGSPSPSDNSPSSTLSLDTRSLKMHEWPPQTDPELERKRMRARRAFANRQRNKSNASQCQDRLEQIKGEIARLQITKKGQQKRLDILNAIWQQYR